MRRVQTSLCTLSLLGVASVVAADAGDHRNDLPVHEGIASSTASIDAATADADATKLISLAPGLHASVVTSSTSAPPNIDQIALWPNAASPTHLIAMNEQDVNHPGMVRIRLSDGLIETILTGTTSGDPIRVTPWGTILAGEEAGASGQVLEIMNPLDVTGVSYDRTSGTVSGGTGAQNVAARPALGHLSFEGLGVMPNGVVYYGDENRPNDGDAGGSYYKFIPDAPFAGGAPITSLSQSPLASGAVYGLKLSRGSHNGQGNNTGLGVWVEIPAQSVSDLRAAAKTLELTGYYRPEDLEVDPAALAAGNVRVCGANTGNETDNNYGEIICINDGALETSTVNGNPEVQFFVIGNPELAMPDNVVTNAKAGFWVFHEDGEGPSEGRNNDIWACSQDGSDFDLLSDSCVRFATLNDLTAESTGGIFDAAGKHFYVSIQHNITGHGVVLDITGWPASGSANAHSGH